MFSNLISKLLDLILPSFSANSFFLLNVMVCDLLDSCFLNMIATHSSVKLVPLYQVTRPKINYYFRLIYTPMPCGYVTMATKN
jgi:hypothetical protein